MKGVSTVEELKEVAAEHDYNFSFLKDIPLGDASRLEGFLYPDTYQFNTPHSPLYAINKMLVNSQSLAVYTTDVNAFAISDIQSLKFVQVATGISAVNGNGLAVNRQGDHLTIMGAKPDDQVSVYSVNGQTVGHFRATEEGTLNLSGLRRGVYIMKINNKTIKISK